MVKRKVISRCWDVMMLKSEDRRNKVKSIKQVSRIPTMVHYRLAFQKWNEFVASERDIEQKVSQGLEYFKQKRQAYALNKMLDNHHFLVERTAMEEKIDQFYFNKQAIQIFDMFRRFLDIQREDRYLSEVAMKYRTNKLATKGLRSWKKYMSDNYELFMKKKSVVKYLREKQCPHALAQWSQYAALSKAYGERMSKSEIFLNKNLIKKGFNSFSANKDERKEFRALYQKASLFHCQKLVEKSYKSLKEYKNYSVEIRKKRKTLEEVLKKVDSDILKQKLFTSLKVFNTSTAIQLAKNQKLLELKKKQRFFNYIRYYKNKVASLKFRYEALKEATDKRTMHRFIMKWVKQYDIEWNIKEMQLNRDMTTKSACFDAIYRNLIISKRSKWFVNRKQKQTMQATFDALVENRRL